MSTIKVSTISPLGTDATNTITLGSGSDTISLGSSAVQSNLLQPSLALCKYSSWCVRLSAHATVVSAIIIQRRSSNGYCYLSVRSRRAGSAVSGDPCRILGASAVRSTRGCRES